MLICNISDVYSHLTASLTSLVTASVPLTVGLPDLLTYVAHRPDLLTNVVCAADHLFTKAMTKVTQYTYFLLSDHTLDQLFRL